jgi:hypothetical protein
MSDQLAVVQNNSIIRSFDDAERAARAMAGSGFFQDTKAANQAIVKILAGQEMGFGPFASMVGVSIIQGKPAVGANLQAAAVKKTGKYNYRVIEMTTTACEIEFYEAGKPVGKSRFTMEDANAAGLASKDNWRKWPRNMLFARAISNGVKWYAPDIFNGATVYTPDELGATVNEDGDVIEGQARPVENTQAQAQYAYADGSEVAPQAIEAYTAYVAEHDGKSPDNVHNLRNWYKKHSQPEQPAE